MFIVSSILDITKMSKSELADFVSITEEMIDDYLNGGVIPKKIKERFATIFSFPAFYFDIDENESEYLRDVMTRSIYEAWENNRPQKYNHEITDDEILDCLIRGYDLVTHKKFDDTHILNNKYVKTYLRKKLLGVDENKVPDEKVEDNDEIIYDNESDNTLDNEKSVYDRLLEWRKEKSVKENLREFMVIGDKVLKNLIDAEINEKKDLLKVSGIGLATFGKYGDEIYEIVKDKDKVEVLN